MRPRAHIQMVADALFEFKRCTAPLDVFLAHFFRVRRFMGSKDRSTVAKRLYFLIRNSGALEAFLQETSAPPASTPTARIRQHILATLWHESRLQEVFTSADITPSPYDFSALTEAEHTWLTQIETLFPDTAARSLRRLFSKNTPPWLIPFFEEAFGADWEQEFLALNESASTDLRVNPLKTPRKEVCRILTAEGLQSELTPYSPLGIRLSPPTRLTSGHPLIRTGQVEFQDEGSQCVAWLAPISPGMTVIDYCAGAGGKTLVLASKMQNKGTLYALDVAKERLDRARPRLQRAGAHNVQLIDLSNTPKWQKRHIDCADCVFIDAPCSGTGTWRRNPDMREKLTRETLERLTEKQLQILEHSAKLVRPGGYLLYVTCSVLRPENEDLVSAFLEMRTDFFLEEASKHWETAFGSSCPCHSGPFIRFTPYQHRTDGFFLAILRRKTLCR